MVSIGHGYGSEDRELGVRLRNNGVASRLAQIFIDTTSSHTKRVHQLKILRQQRWKIRKLFFTRQARVSQGIATACERSLATAERKYTYTPATVVFKGPSLLRFTPREPTEGMTQTDKRKRVA